VAGAVNSFFINDNYPWNVGFWKTYIPSMTEGKWTPIVTSWDALGNAYGGTVPFSVIEGTVRLNAPGEKFNITITI